MASIAAGRSQGGRQPSRVRARVLSTRGTADYRAYVEEAMARGVHVDSIRLGIWSQGEIVAVRGRLRVRQGRTVNDSRMYWVHRVRDGKVHWTGSSPDLGGLLAEAGLPGRGITNEAFMALHRDPEQA